MKTLSPPSLHRTSFPEGCVSVSLHRNHDIVMAPFRAIASHKPQASPGPLAIPPAVIAPQKSASRKPSFRFLFGLELHGRWNSFSSRNKSHVKAVRATVGISGKPRNLETRIWPAAWKAISDIATSGSHAVGLCSGLGLMV